VVSKVFVGAKTDLRKFENVKTEVLAPQEVARILNKSLRWVYKYGYDLGGVKIGGSWIFTKESLFNALQARKEMACSGYYPRAAVSKAFSNKARSPIMGGSGKKKTVRKDPHGLLA